MSLVAWGAVYGWCTIGTVSSGREGGADQQVGATSAETLLQAEVAAVLDVLPVMVLEVDEGRQRLRSATPAFAELLGCRVDELIGAASPFPWLAPGQAAVFDEIVVAAGEPEHRRRRLMLQTLIGEPIPTTALATVLTAPDVPDQVIVVLEVLRDVDRTLVNEVDRAKFLSQLANERDRIARDLHDRVIQRLFAVGMELEAAADLLAGGVDVRTRLWQAVEDIDAAMSEIRSTVYTLHRPLSNSPRPFDGLQATVEATSRLLGHHPELTIAGPLSSVPIEIATEVTVVVRELLTNVIKHAESNASWVTVTVADDRVSVVVEDDGIGAELLAGSMPEVTSSGGVGLRGLAERAGQLGGSTEVGPRAAGGTRVEWSVPLGHPPH